MVVVVVVGRSRSKILMLDARGWYMAGVLYQHHFHYSPAHVRSFRETGAFQSL